MGICLSKTKEEEAAEKDFKTVDIDNSGKLSKAEMRDFVGRRALFSYRQ